MTFPPIEPGGSLLLAWQLQNKRVLIVGGGEVASGRLRNVLEADALVTLIAPLASLHPEVHYRIFDDPSSRDRITYHNRNFHIPTTPFPTSPTSPPPSLSSSTSSYAHLSESTHEEVVEVVDDLAGIDMVLTAIDDVATSQLICTLSRTAHIPINAADIPPSCDFYFGSLIRRGPLQILISTNGKGPKIANIIRRRIEATVPEGTGAAIGKVGELRERLRGRTGGVVGGEVGRKRMRWMIGVCEGWTLEELGEMDEAMMEKLLDEGWESGGKVPLFKDIKPSQGVDRVWVNQLKQLAASERVKDVLAGMTVGVIAAAAVFHYQR